MSKNQNLLYTALNENKLFEFIAGRDNYEIVNVYADTPTDSMEVLSSLKDYYDATGDFTIWKEFNNAIVKLVEDENLVWFSLYYLNDILRLRNRDVWTHEYIDIADLLKKIEFNLLLFKNNLSKNKSWVGREYEKGLWEDVLRLKKNIFDSYGIDLNLIGNTDSWQKS